MSQEKERQNAIHEVKFEDEARTSQDAAERSASGAASADDLPAICEKLKAEKGELYDRLLRKQAELENVRKRVQREKEEFLQHAEGELIRSLLPSLDGLDRALAHREPGVPEKYYEGLKLIQRQLMTALQKAGLTEIETAGKRFDPHLHQAVETVESPDHEDQDIVEELQRGYQLRNHLLRPAIVKVAVHSSPSERRKNSSDDTGRAKPA